MEKTFLNARWKDLIMINYEIDPLLLEKYVPKGTELDSWEGKTFVSLVGFNFFDTKVKGLSIPFHQNFEEVNLRFYVKCTVDGEVRRGVVFIKEIVPKFAISLVARTFYNENYVTHKTRHKIEDLGDVRQVRYEWKSNDRWNSFAVETKGSPQPIRDNSEEEFIAEHYWGYCQQKDGTTKEYEVEHPRWNIHSDCKYEVDIEIAENYGEEFVEALSAKPSSVFLADGSEIIVRDGSRLKNLLIPTNLAGAWEDGGCVPSKKQ